MKVALGSERSVISRITQRFQNGPAGCDLRAARRPAIRRAYRHFAQRYPRWAHSLFDEYFVICSAQEVLSTGLLNAEALADAWTRQLYYRDETMRRRHTRQILPAAEIFVRLVRAEMI